MRPIYINGKFYAGGLNGVHRVADRLIQELDRRLAALPADRRPPVTLFLPTRRTWSPSLTTIRMVEHAKAHSQIWEQATLPRLARDGLLLNLCNLAPLLHRRKLLMLHDAQFLFPDSSYPARQRWGYRLLTPLMARSSLKVLTVSAYSRQMLDLFGVCPRERSTVLPNGGDHLRGVAPDAGLVEALGLKPRAYAVHIASAKAYKNSAVLFDAFADPRLADIALVLVGPDRAALRAAGLTPPPGVVFAGRIDDAGLRALYEDALCLLTPSRTEGFGLPPLEAMAVGCVSVVSPAGALPETCRDAVLYADVDRPESWVDAVRTYADRDDVRNLKRSEGLKRADALTWAATGDQLFDLVMKLDAGAGAV